MRTCGASCARALIDPFRHRHRWLRRSLRALGWQETIRHRRGKGDFGNLNIKHLAKRLLRYLSMKGAPVVLTTPPWDHKPMHAAAAHGPHKSACACQQFLREEMAEMIPQGHWIILLHEEVRGPPGLRLSPIGAVPQ